MDWQNKFTNDIMLPNLEVINKLKSKRNSYYYILWTCREGKALKNAIKFCNEYNLTFDAINDNILNFRTSRKIIADIYLDDKGGLENWLQKI